MNVNGKGAFASREIFVRLANRFFPGSDLVVHHHAHKHRHAPTIPLWKTKRITDANGARPRRFGSKTKWGKKTSRIKIGSLVSRWESTLGVSILDSGFYQARLRSDHGEWGDRDQPSLVWFGLIRRKAARIVSRRWSRRLGRRWQKEGLDQDLFFVLLCAVHCVM